MRQALRPPPRMTREEFFAWCDSQEQDEAYEFDGYAPVAMTRPRIVHSRIVDNLKAALRARLRGTGCEALGPEAGVATVDEAIRFPDVVVTCARTPGQSRYVQEPLIVFEVISPGRERADRIVKPREYAGVPSILRYVIIEADAAAATMLSRTAGDAPWTLTGPLDADDAIVLPEISIEVPLAELREGLDA